MDGHLKLFQYLSQYEDFIKSPDYLDPNVSWVLENDKVYYNYTPINNGGNEQVKPYESEYLTMELLEEGKLTFARVLCKDVMYSTDNGNTWAEIDNGAESIMEGDISNLVYTPTFPAGTKVLWKSNIDKSLIGASPLEGIDVLGLFGSTCKYNLSGNIMSLIYGDDYITNSELIIDGASLNMPFYGMFGMLNTMIHEDLGDTMSFPGVVDAANLILPTMTLTDYCYYMMFYACTSLKYAPALPVTTLTYGCYTYMFGVCTSLTTAPELPATTLANDCYCGMFYDCISLINAPELPATTLANRCYYEMFSGCSNLNEITMLATDVSATDCLKEWVIGVSATGTFTKHYSMASLPTGGSGIPSGWTVQDNATLTECTNLEITAYDVVGNKTNTTIHYTATVNGIDTFGNDIIGAVLTGTAISEEFEQNLSETETIERTISFEFMGVTATTTIIQDIYIHYEEQYLTFEAIKDGTFKLTQNACEYSLDNGTTWTSISAGTNTPTVSAGSKIMFKATNPSITDYYGIGVFSSTGKFNVSGNIMSMLYGDGFVGKIDLTSKVYVFRHLFQNCTKLVDATELILPATTLAYGCYNSMFDGCTSLVTAPALPATTLANNCYNGMFISCTSLTSAPALPATTLADYCYYSMFSGCTSLVTAPELPATTLRYSCYSFMFNACTNLTTAPSILPATTLANYCYAVMFQGCTSLVNAPELPATTLTVGCYNYMFSSCSNLNNITMLATDVSATDCLYHWVNGVASTGTFVKSSAMTSLPSGVNGIPEGWTVENYG